MLFRFDVHAYVTFYLFCQGAVHIAHVEEPRRTKYFPPPFGQLLSFEGVRDCGFGVLVLNFRCPLHALLTQGSCGPPGVRTMMKHGGVPRLRWAAAGSEAGGCLALTP